MTRRPQPPPDTPSRLGPIRVRRDREGTKLIVDGVLYAVRPTSFRRTPPPWLALAAAPWSGARRPGRVAILGYGGGTLARLLRRGDPELRIAGVDLDRRMLELGRRHLASALPGVRIDEGDATTWLARPGRPFDAILDDIYAPLNGWLVRPVDSVRIPGVARTRLRPGGIYAVSLRCPGGRPERVLVSGIMQNFRHVLVIYMSEYAHKVVLASEEPLDRAGFARGLRQLAGARKAGAGMKPVDPVTWGFDPIRRGPRPRIAPERA
jgi:spermidine synthase